MFIENFTQKRLIDNKNGIFIYYTLVDRTNIMYSKVNMGNMST